MVWFGLSSNLRLKWNRLYAKSVHLSGANLFCNISSTTCLFVTYTVFSHRLKRLDCFTVAKYDSRNSWGNNELLQPVKTHEGKTAFEELYVILTCRLCSTSIIQLGKKFKMVISNINVSWSPPQEHTASAINSLLRGHFLTSRKRLVSHFLFMFFLRIPLNTTTILWYNCSDSNRIPLYKLLECWDVIFQE